MPRFSPALMTDRDRLALVLILALGAALRLFHVDAAFLDTHAWRQLDTAAMARNFYEDGFLPFDPQVDWGGRHGYLEAEFPLVPALIAAVYRVVGLHETAARLFIVLTGVALIWAVYRLSLALDGRLPAGPRRGVPDRGVADGRVLRPHRDSRHADDALSGARTDRLRRIRASWLDEVAFCRRSVPHACLPAQAASRFCRPGDRHRTRACPGLARLPRPSGLDFRRRAPGLDRGRGTGTRTKSFCAPD